MISIVHTLPDYTTKYKMTKVFGNIDTGELAARLGSPNTFDRRGNVVFMEDFEAANIHWETRGNGAGNAVALDPTAANTKEQSCKLTAGAGIAGTAIIERSFSASSIGQIGVEMSSRIDANTKYMIMDLHYDDGTNVYLGVVRYNHSALKMEWLHGGAWEDLIPSYRWATAEYCFHTMKLVINIDTKEYVRFLVGNTEVNMAGRPLRTMAIGDYEAYTIQITHESDNAAAKSAWVDDIILTQNEP